MRIRFFRALGMALAAVTASLALPAASGATPTWLTPMNLSEPGQEAQGIDAAMSPGGAGAVVWSRSDGTYERIQAATRAPFTTFAAPIDVSAKEQDGLWPEVAEDGAGAATVVWMNVTTSPVKAEVATVVDGMPSAPVAISGALNADFPTIAENERGDAIVAWQSSDGKNEVIYATFRAAGGSFTTPVQISAGGENAVAPRVAIDAAGEAAVVWRRSNGANEIIEGSRLQGGSFSPAEALSEAGQSAEEPQVAMDAAGDTAVTWIRSNGSDKVAQVFLHPAGQPKLQGTRASLSTSTKNAAYPAIAMDGHGDPTVAWSLEDVVQVVSGTIAGAFGSPVNLGYPDLFPSVAEDAAGDVLVGDFEGVHATASASFRPAGGSFGAPVVVSPNEQNVGPSPTFGKLGMNVAIDGAGNGLFGYRSADGVYLAGATLLDGAGPELNGLSIPSSGTAGAPVSFAVAPIDQFSGVASTTWSFGDGSSVSGTSVTHTFASPGTYTVAVTATDGVGNSATHNATITIAAAPTPPPAPALKPAGLGSSTVTADSHGHVSLKVSCPAGGATCTGTVTLTLAATASGLAVAARAHGVAVSVPAGHASFTVTAGQTRAVSITLPAVVAKLLAKRHGLKLTATVQTTVSGQSTTKTSTLTVKAPKKPKKRKGKRH